MKISLYDAFILFSKTELNDFISEKINNIRVCENFDKEYDESSKLFSSYDFGFSMPKKEDWVNKNYRVFNSISFVDGKIFIYYENNGLEEFHQTEIFGRIEISGNSYSRETIESINSEISIIEKKAKDKFIEFLKQRYRGNLYGRINNIFSDEKTVSGINLSDLEFNISESIIADSMGAIFVDSKIDYKPQPITQKTPRKIDLCISLIRLLLSDREIAEEPERNLINLLNNRLNSAPKNTLLPFMRIIKSGSNELKILAGDRTVGKARKLVAQNSDKSIYNNKTNP